MRLYCICDKSEPVNAKLSSKRYLLMQSMNVSKVGAEQWIKVPDGSGAIKEHYPAVDIYECPHCGAKIALEG